MHPVVIAVYLRSNTQQHSEFAERWSSASGYRFPNALTSACQRAAIGQRMISQSSLSSGASRLSNLWSDFGIAASLLGLRNHMISLMPCAEASTVSPVGTPSRNMRTDACPLVSTQSSVTPFQHHAEIAAMNVATRLRPVTGTPAARTSPPPSE